MSYQALSNTELAVLLTKDDELAFREFYLRYRDKLWHYAFHFLKSEEETDDIIQETFLRFWELRIFIDPELSISSLLYTMTKNRILNYFRAMDAEAQLKKALQVKLPAEMETTDAGIVLADYRKILTNAIDLLPPQRKRIFRMSRMENKSHKEIAARLGISVSTVQEHISESLRFIKIYFKRHTDLTLGIMILETAFSSIIQ
jgi:RNA polymerase sigma-70 factor (ECF subfamily)